MLINKTDYPFELFASPSVSGQTHSSTSALSLHSARPLNAAQTQVSVNATHGNVLLHDKQFTIADDGLELSVGMIWNSADNCWRFSAKSSAKVNESSVGRLWSALNYTNASIDITEADGRIVKYVKQNNQYVCAEPDQHGISIITEVNGKWVRTFPDTGMKEIYDNTGNLQTQTLATGRKIEYRYNERNDVCGIMLPSGREIQLNAVQGGLFQFSLSLVNPDNTAVALCAYEMDPVNPGSLVTSIPQPNGAMYQTKYINHVEQGKRKISIVSDDATSHQLSLNLNGKIESLQTGDDLWKFVADATKNKLAVLANNQAVMDVTVDKLGHLASFNMAGDEQGYKFECDNGGRPLRVTAKNGNVSATTYDEVTGLAKVITKSVNGVVIENSYESNGLSPQYGLCLVAIMREGERVAKTRFIYNDKRQCVFEISPEGRVKHFSYHSESPYRLRESRQLPVKYSIAEYPILDTMNQWLASIPAETMAKIAVIKYGYDQFGRHNTTETWVRDVVIESNRQELDAFGRPTGTYTLATSSNLAYDGLGRVTKASQATEASPLFRTTEHEFRANLTVTKKPNGLTVTSEKDAGGQEKLTTSSSSQDKSAVRPVNTEHNADGSIKCVTRHDGSRLRYFYDRPGHVKYTLCSREGVHEYLYDKSDRHVGTKKYDLKGDDTIQDVKQLTALIAKCDRSLASLALQDDEGNIRFEVNVKRVLTENGEEYQGCITEHQYSLGKRVATLVRATVLRGEQLNNLDVKTLSALSLAIENKDDRVTRSVYDLDGNLLRKWVKVSVDEKTGISSGYYETYEYDALGHQISKDIVLDKLAFSDQNVVDLVAMKKLNTRYWYDAAGRKIATLDPDNYLTTYRYNLKGQLESRCQHAQAIPELDRQALIIELPNAGADDKLSLYEYDELGRQICVTEPVIGIKTRINYSDNDSMITKIRLDTRTGKVRKTQECFDEFGELISKASERTSATDDGENRKHWTHKIFHPVTGLMLQEIDELGHATLYYYGANKKPVLVINPLGEVLQTDYDLLTNEPTEVRAYYKRIPEAILKNLQADIMRNGYFDEKSLADSLPQCDTNDRVRTATYNTDGKVNLQTKVNGGREFSFYSAFNQLEKSKVEIEKNKFLETVSSHDLRGNVSQTVVDPDGLAIQSTEKHDDALNRVTESSDANGYTVGQSYEGLRRTTLQDMAEITRVKVMTQDAFMRPKSESDWQNSNVSSHEYKDSERQHTLVNPVSSDRNIIENVNGFGEVETRVVAGQTTTFKLGTDGQEEDVINPDGSKTSTGYDARGDKESATSLLGLESSFVRDAARNLRDQIDDVNGEKRLTQNLPNAFGELEMVTDATKLSVAHMIQKGGLTEIELTDPNKLWLSKQRIKNFVGQVVSLVRGDVKDLSRYREQFDRDLVGNELARKIDLGDGKFAVLMETKYDKKGHAIQITDGNGNVTYHAYDKRGNRRFTLDPMGFVTEFIYDANNYVTREIKYAKAVSLLTPEVFANPIPSSEEDYVTNYIRDADGLSRFEICGSTAIEYRYNGAKKITDKIVYALPIDLTVIALADIPALLATDAYAMHAKNRRTHTDYDAMNRVKLSRDAEGGEISYLYDQAGNEVFRSHNGERNYYSIYDKFGNQRFVIDAKGYVKELRFNAVNVCTDEIKYSRPLSELFSLEQITALEAILCQGGVHRDLDNILGKLVSVASTLALPEKDVHLVSTLDAAHRTVGKKDGEGNVEGYLLDGLNQVREKTDKRSNLWKNKFNKANKLEKATSPAINVTVVSQDAATLSLNDDVTLFKRVKSEYGYDSSFNQTAITQAANIAAEKRVLDISFGKNNLIDGTTIKDVLVGTAEETITKDVKTGIIRDYAGREIIKTLENGGREFTVYDQNGRERYKIDAEGYIIELQYTHTFSEPTKVIHYYKAMEAKLLIGRDVGFSIGQMKDICASQKSKFDRSLTYTYDRNGKKLSVIKDAGLTAKAVIDKEGERVVVVKKFARQTFFDYNHFTEIVSERRQRLDGQSEAITQRFYDHNGNEYLTITPQGYVTVRTYGMENIGSEGGKYLEKSSIQYFNPVPTSARGTLASILAAIVPDAKNDRSMTKKYDRRHLCIETTIADGHPFFNTYREEDRKLATRKENPKLTTKIAYDACSKPIMYTNAYDEKSYLIRDAVGNVIWEIGYPVELTEGVKSIPVTQHLYNAHQQQVGSTVYANPGNLEFDAKGNIKLENLVIPSDLDQKTLILMSNRGQPLVTQSSHKGMTFSAYNEMKRKTREQRLVTVSDLDENGKPRKIKVKREDLWKYSLRGDVLMKAAIDEFERVESHYLYNAFRECTDEGPALGDYCIHNRFDNAGVKWFSNADRAIATITFSDEAEAEVIVYRSAKRDLLKYMVEDGDELAKAELADVDYEKAYTEFQRFVTYRNLDEQGIRQDTPWYKQRPKFEPENYPIAFTIMKDSTPGATNYFLRFDAPDEVFLKMDFKIRVKGTEEWIPLTIKETDDVASNRKFCDIALGNLPADAYDYCLDFYHVNLVNDKKVQNRLPSYRASGDVMLDTGHYEASKHPIWFTENSSTLVIVGNAKNIYGIELVKEGQPFKRIAGTRGVDGKLRIDLSQEQCTDYSFKYVLGVDLVAEKLQVGQPGDNSVSIYQPVFRFDSANSISVINNSLPPEIIRHLQFETALATQSVPYGPHYPGDNYDIQHIQFYWSKPIATAFLSIVDAHGISRYSQHIVANAPWRFSVWDEKFGSKYYKNYTQLPANPTPALLTVKAKSPADVHALQVSMNDGSALSYQLVGIENNQLLALSGNNLNLPANAQLNLVSLSNRETSEVIATLCLGGVGNQIFQAEELAITGFTIDKSFVGGYHKNDAQCADNYFTYEWECSVSQNYHLQVRHVGVNGPVMDIKSLPKSGVGNQLYYQHVEGHGQNYDPGVLAVDIVRDGVVIPLGQGLNQHAAPANLPFQDIDDYNYPSRGVWVTMRAQTTQKYKYDAMHALYFKHLPEGTDNVAFEYCFTTSLGKKVWRTAECKMGSLNGLPSGLSVFTNNIAPGNYECRILPRKGNQPVIVKDPRYQQDAEGYCYLHVNITKRQTQYGQVFSSHQRDLMLKLVKPFREFGPDRWKNLRFVTDRKGNKVESKFNIYNQAIKTITPPVLHTRADGVTEAPQPLKTKSRINKRAHLVEKIDAGDDSMKFLANQFGKNLCEEDADGVQMDHEYDLFQHTVSSRAIAFGTIRSSFRRVEGLLVETRTYPNNSTEELTYNEEGHVIRHEGRMARKGNDDDALHIHPDGNNNRRVAIQPKSSRDKSKHPVVLQEFHPRSKVMTKQVDAKGRQQSWEVDIESRADAYVGNIAKHIDLDGQVITYTPDFTKQIVREVGKIGDATNRDLIHIFDEAGRESDIIDNGAKLTTRKRHNKEDYSKEYYFIGQDGRVYQATNTKYDELHRISQICDTHILVEFGYDKKSNRRYAKASVLGDNGKFEPFDRESWYDYSPAGRVRFRDCVMAACKIQLSSTQGMEVTHKDGRVETQKTLTKEGLVHTSTPIYGIGSAIAGIVTQTEGEEPKVEERETDAADRVFKRTVTDKEKKKKVTETFVLDTDNTMLSQVTETTTTDEKGKWHKVITTRTVISKSDEEMVEKVETVLKDVAHDVVKDIDIIVTDEVKTKFKGGNSFTPVSVASRRISAVKGGEGDRDDKRIVIDDYAKTVKEEKLTTLVDTNGSIVGIGPEAPISEGVYPDGYRSFVVNSEQCYLLKETNKGRNYYFYAQKRPGKTTLMAYFGDLSDEVANIRATYQPTVMNMDLNHEAFSSNYPPSYPGKCMADGTKTYRQIAEDLNFTGYAEAIAWANNADADSVPQAGTEIVLPTLVHEVPETAQNGAMPAVEMLLGSMYPALSMPKISIHPPKINWGLIAVEVAVGAAVTYMTAGALGEFVGAYIGSEIAAAAVTYALAGAVASVATQGVAMAAGEQNKFNAKSMATQAIASGVSAGVLKGFGFDPSSAAARSFALEDVAKNIAMAEAVAAGQQAFLMAAGLQSKPDWTGFMTAGVNALVDIGVHAQFGTGSMSTGVYTGVTMAADGAIRGQRLDATVLSANMVGAMLGSYVGHEALNFLQDQQIRHANERAASTAQAPRAVPTPTPTSTPRQVPAAKPANVSKRAAQPVARSSAASDDVLADIWVADEYSQTNSLFANNKMTLWKSRDHQMRTAGADVRVQNRRTDSRFMEYVDGFNMGVEAGASTVARSILHPLSTLQNVGMTVWDGYNAIGDVAFGLSTQASRARNMQRGAMMNQAEQAFVYGDGVMRTKMLAEFATMGVLSAGAGVAFEAAGITLVSRAGLAVKTPYGYAYQSLSLDALFERMAIRSGESVYRVGSFGFNAGPEAQFWATTNPTLANAADYAMSYGLPAENAGSGFVISGNLPKNSIFVTRKAPSIGSNSGGAIEVVTPPGAVRLDSWTMP